MSLRPVALGALLLLPLVFQPHRAHAGLRTPYGGELVVLAPAAPETTDPARAWSLSEVALSPLTGTRLVHLADAVQAPDGRSLRLVPRPGTAWPDGAAPTAQMLAQALSRALSQSVVALPPFAVRADRNEVLVELPFALPDAARYLDLPWLRLVRGGEGGPFRWKRGVLEAHPEGLGGRPYVDQVRVEVKEGRKVEPAPGGIALGRAGADGRLVFALPRPAAPRRPALQSALAGVDRAALARLFVRGVSRVPPGWTPSAGAAAASAPGQVVLAVDAAERDLRTVADRLQVVLRDRRLEARVVSEERGAYFSRLAKGDYDLALVALPAAPPLVQAATLARLASAPARVDAVWKAASAGQPPDEVLRETARDLGAVLLYAEGGGVALGERVRGIASPPPWPPNLADVWLMPPGAPP